MFLVFPDGCITYDGPKSLQCYESIWLNAGCSREGRDWPKNLDSNEIQTVNILNLRYI